MVFHVFVFSHLTRSDVSSSLQGQADLLKHARSEVQENLKQIHYAALTCNLSKGGAVSGSSESKNRRSLGAIPEKATAEEELSDEDNWSPILRFARLFLPPELKPWCFLGPCRHCCTHPCCSTFHWEHSYTPNTAELPHKSLLIN